MDASSIEASKGKGGVSFTRWAVILLVVHPLSLGPVLYLDARGRFSLPASDAAMGLFYAPEIYVLMYDVPYLRAPSEGYRNYVTWWQELGKAHARSVPAATAAPSE